MSTLTYNAAKVGIANGTINWEADDIYVALVTSSYVPNKDTDVYFSDITNEVTGTGYTTGGFALANMAITQDNTNDRAIFSADDLNETGLTITAYQQLVVYSNTTVASTSPLICVIDLGSTYALDNDTLNISWATGGVFNIT